MSELLPLGGSEGYGVRADEANALRTLLPHFGWKSWMAWNKDHFIPYIPKIRLWDGPMGGFFCPFFEIRVGRTFVHSQNSHIFVLS